MVPTSIILFGATGDLAQHKLLPALYEIIADGKEDVQIIALGRRDYNEQSFLQSLPDSMRDRNSDVWAEFSRRFRYYKMNILNEQDYSALARYLEEVEDGRVSNRLFYLSVAPEHYPSILNSLSQHDLATNQSEIWRRIVVEKPFGHDLASSQSLNQVVADLFEEEQIYRVDHYLAKETVQNILAFRFANGIFEPLWNKYHIDHLQITVAEDEGIKNRGSYFDPTGAFRDFVQNHILQLLCFLTMEEPTDFSFSALSDEKLKILSALSVEDEHTFYGQYEGYLQEKDVSVDSKTETFAAAKLYIQTDRWEGTPVYIRTGKKLAKRISEVSVVFKPSHQHLFKTDSKHPNILSFRLQPDEGISLQLDVKRPKESMRVEPVQMEFCYASAFRTNLPDAYQRLFYDILNGERALFLRIDSIEKSWELIDHILEQKSHHTLYTYAPGSWGPSQVDEAMQAEDRKWLVHESKICNGIVVGSDN